jgi:hypothetical protein
MAKGDIVLITFPFTDLSSSKLRPGVVLADTNPDFTYFMTHIYGMLPYHASHSIKTYEKAKFSNDCHYFNLFLQAGR